jgi:hypothetical protein
MSWPLLCINIGDELAYIYDFSLTLRYIIMIDELVLPGRPSWIELNDSTLLARERNVDLIN